MPRREIPQDATTFQHPVGDALRVRILGRPGKGKTTLALALKLFLEKEGLTVRVKDIDLEDEMQAHNPEMQAMRLEALRQQGRLVEIDQTIEIETVPVRAPVPV